MDDFVVVQVREALENLHCVRSNDPRSQGSICCQHFRQVTAGNVSTSGKCEPKHCLCAARDEGGRAVQTTESYQHPKTCGTSPGHSIYTHTCRRIVPPSMAPRHAPWQALRPILAAARSTLCKHSAHKHAHREANRQGKSLAPMRTLPRQD